MSTTLCFDFGNTRRKVAVIKNEELNKIILLADDKEQTIQSLIEVYKTHK